MLLSQRISRLRAMGSHIMFTGLCEMSFHQPLDEYQRNSDTSLDFA